MATDRKKLRSTLAELHAELDTVDSLDSDVDQHLRAAMAEIQAVLDRKPSSLGARTETSLVRRLSQSAEHFEQSHPTLSGILGSIVDALGGIGI